MTDSLVRNAFQWTKDTARSVYTRIKKFETPRAKKRRRKLDNHMRSAIMLAPRKRNLTIGKPDLDLLTLQPPQVPRRTDNQYQSPLFKIPFEIRQQIYGYVISGYLIYLHYRQDYRSPYPRRCRDGDRCSYCKRSRRDRAESLDLFGSNHLLALPKTCRKMLVLIEDLLWYTLTSS
jgi:hypothetical protein